MTAIMGTTKLDEVAVRNAIKRLQWQGDIRRKFEGGYAIVHNNCLLERYWPHPIYGPPSQEAA